MQKKWVIGITAMSLAAVTAIGSTLAYFTTKTQQMTNNFTVKAPKGITAQLREPAWDGYGFNAFVGTNDPDGTTAVSNNAVLGLNQAKVMMPGATISKDPTLMNTTNWDFSKSAVEKDKADVPVYMAIKVINNMNNASIGFNSNWHKLDLTNYKLADKAVAGDIYVWYGDVSAKMPAQVASGKPTEPLFSTVQISRDAIQSAPNVDQDKVLKDFNIQLQGSAVQADNLTDTSDLTTINDQLASELGYIK